MVIPISMEYEPTLTEAIRNLMVDTGIVSALVYEGSNTLTDSTKNWANGIHKNRLVKIVGAAISGAGQMAVIDNNTSNTIIIKGKWPKAIGAGAAYIILEKDTAQILREVLNAGYDITAAHPLETHDPKVEEVEDKLDHPNYGLAALKALIDSLAGGAFYGSYGPKNVEVDNDVDFGTILYDPSGNIITVGEITPGTYTIHRVREAIDIEIVAAAAASEAAGRVYITYDFPAASWNVGDIFHVTFSGITVTSGSAVTEYPNLFTWGRVVREADVATKVETAQYGDRVYFDRIIGIAGTAWPVGTPQVPSNVIADIITICAARNIRTIQVRGPLTLGAAMQRYSFFSFKHYDDIVDLNGQSVYNSYFEGLLITGTQGGGGFCTYKDCMLSSIVALEGLLMNCSLNGSIAVSAGAGSYSDLYHCTSVWGAVTVTVGTPSRLSFKEFSGALILTAQTGGPVYVRGISGYLEVNAMVGGTLDIYAHGAEIVINNTCNGGVINIYGNARVTDNSAAGCTVNNYTAGSIQPTDDTYSLPNDVAENTAFTIAITRPTKLNTLWLNMVNLVQNATVRVKVWDSITAAYVTIETFPWTIGMDDGIYLREITVNSNVQVSVQSAIAQGAAMDIYYHYSEEEK